MLNVYVVVGFLVEIVSCLWEYTMLAITFFFMALFGLAYFVWILFYELASLVCGLFREITRAISSSDNASAE